MSAAGRGTVSGGVLTPAQYLASADTTAADIQADGTQAAGSVGKLADSGHVHPENLPFDAVDYGDLLLNMTVESAVGSSAMIAGTVYLLRVNVRASLTAASIRFYVTAAGNDTGGSGNNFVGLYNSGGTLLSGSGNAASAMTNTGWRTVALSSSQPLTAGYYWIALLANLGTTQPTLARSSVPSIGVASLGLSASAFRAAVNGTVQTALPSPITPGSNSLTGAIFFLTGID